MGILVQLMLQAYALAVPSTALSISTRCLNGSGFQAPPVAAQSSVAPESAPRGLEEIIVTARRRSEPLLQVPVAVTALSAEQLDARSLTSLMQVGAFAPNVTTSSAHGASGASSSGQMYIRGVGQLDFLFTTDPGVAVYIDGVYFPRTVGAVIDLLDLERVEILRGPQGTLFGKNAIGGAVNVVSVEPGDGAGGYAQLTVGSLDRLEARAAIELPAVAGQLTTRLAASHKRRDGYARRIDPQTGVQTAITGDEDQQSIRAAARWRPTDRLLIDLTADLARWRQHAVPATLLQFDDAGAYGGVPRALWNALVGVPSGTPMTSEFISGRADVSFATGPDRDDLDQWGASLTIEADLGGVDLLAITAYREMEATFGQDSDGSPLPYFHTLNRQDQHQSSQEVTLQDSVSDGTADWLIGLFHMREFGRDRNDVVLASGLYSALELLPVQLNGSPCVSPFTVPGCAGNPINRLFDLELDVFNQIDIESAAVFAQGNLAVTPRL